MYHDKVTEMRVLESAKDRTDFESEKSVENKADRKEQAAVNGLDHRARSLVLLGLESFEKFLPLERLGFRPAILIVPIHKTCTDVQRMSHRTGHNVPKNAYSERHLCNGVEQRKARVWSTHQPK